MPSTPCTWPAKARSDTMSELDTILGRIASRRTRPPRRRLPADLAEVAGRAGADPGRRRGPAPAARGQRGDPLLRLGAGGQPVPRQVDPHPLLLRLGGQPAGPGGRRTWTRASRQIAHGETVRETANMISFLTEVIGIRDDMYLGEGHAYMSEVAAAAGRRPRRRRPAPAAGGGQPAVRPRPPDPEHGRPAAPDARLRLPRRTCGARTSP